MGPGNDHQSLPLPQGTGWNNAWIQSAGSPFQTSQRTTPQEIAIQDNVAIDNVDDEFGELRALLEVHNSAPELQSPQQTLHESVSNDLEPILDYNGMEFSEENSPCAPNYQSQILPERDTFHNATDTHNSGRYDKIIEQPRRNAVVENHELYTDCGLQSPGELQSDDTAFVEATQDTEVLSIITTSPEVSSSGMPFAGNNLEEDCHQQSTSPSSQIDESPSLAPSISPQLPKQPVSGEIIAVQKNSNAGDSQDTDVVLGENIVVWKDINEGDGQDAVSSNEDNSQSSKLQRNNSSSVKRAPTPPPATVGELSPEVYYAGEGVDPVEEYQNRGRRFKPLHVFTPPTNSKYIGLKQADKLRARVPVIPPIPFISRTTAQMFLSFMYLLSQRDWEDWDQSFVMESEKTMSFFMKLVPRFDYPSRIRHLTNKKVFLDKLEKLMLDIASEHWAGKYTDKYKAPDEFDDRDPEHPNFKDVTIPFKDYSTREDMELLALADLLLRKSEREVSREAEIRIKDPERSFNLTSWRYRKLHQLTQVNTDPEASSSAIASLQRKIAAFVPGKDKQTESEDVSQSVPETQSLTEEEFLEKYSYYMPVDREQRVAIKTAILEEAALKAASQAKAMIGESDSSLPSPQVGQATKQGAKLKDRLSCDKYPKPKSIAKLKRAADAAKTAPSSDGRLRRNKGKTIEIQSLYGRKASSRASKDHAREKTKQMYQNLPDFDDTDDNDVDMLGGTRPDYGYGAGQFSEPMQRTGEDCDNIISGLFGTHVFSDTDISDSESIMSNGDTPDHRQQIDHEDIIQSQLLDEHDVDLMDTDDQNTLANPSTSSSGKIETSRSQAFQPQDFGADELVSDIDANTISDEEQLVPSDLPTVKLTQSDKVRKPKRFSFTSLPVKKRIPLPSSPVSSRQSLAPAKSVRKITSVNKMFDGRPPIKDQSSVRKTMSKSYSTGKKIEQLSKIVSFSYLRSKKIYDFLNGTGEVLASIADGFGSTSHPYTGGKTLLPPMPDVASDDETSSSSRSHPQTSSKTLHPAAPARVQKPKVALPKSSSQVNTFDNLNSNHAHPQVSVKSLLTPSPKRVRKSKIKTSDAAQKDKSSTTIVPSNNRKRTDILDGDYSDDEDYNPTFTSIQRRSRTKAKRVTFEEEEEEVETEEDDSEHKKKRAGARKKGVTAGTKKAIKQTGLGKGKGAPKRRS